MQKEFTDEQRATLGSINSFMGNLAFGVFAVILGVFADKFGPIKALLIAYIFSLKADLTRLPRLRNCRVVNPTLLDFIDAVLNSFSQKAKSTSIIFQLPLSEYCIFLG